MDSAVLRLGIVGVHSADIGDSKTAVILNFRDHPAEGIGMRFEEERVGSVLSAEIDQNAAFAGQFRRKAKRFKGFLYPFSRFCGKSGGTVDGEKLRRFFAANCAYS